MCAFGELLPLAFIGARNPLIAAVENNGNASIVERLLAVTVDIVGLLFLNKKILLSQKLKCHFLLFLGKHYIIYIYTNTTQGGLHWTTVNHVTAPICTDRRGKKLTHLHLLIDPTYA